MLDGVQFLGRVVRAPSPSDAYRYATLLPLVESDPDGLEWRGAVRNAAVRFPKRGLVHWHDAPPGVDEGSIWQFSIEEHQLAERRNRPELFQCTEPLEAIEVIDLRAWTDEMALRSAISSSGVFLDPAPLARCYLLWLASGLCVGPLRMRATADRRGWLLDRPESHVDLARVAAWRIGDGGIQQVGPDLTRWFLAPAREFGQSAGIQNWAPDDQVARSILRRLRKIDASAVKALHATDAVFDAYLDRLESAGVSRADADLERARADRLRGIRAAIASNSALVAEAAEALRESSDVRGELSRQVDEERRRLLQQAQAEIDAEVAPRRAELEELRGEVDAHRGKLTEMDEALRDKERSLRELEQSLADKVATFDEALTARLQELASRPESLFAEMAIVRAALRPVVRGLQGPERPRGGPLGATPMESSDGGGSPIRLDDEQALMRELSLRSRSTGASLHGAMALHAALAAGTIPLLVGQCAYDLARAYASAAAGGRVHWVPVGSAMLESQDLFGHFEPALGRIVPHPAGVLDVVLDAKTSGRLHVVVLEGFNRAPVEAYLLPILESAAAVRNGDSTRAVPIASPALLVDDDPYRDMARVIWPANVVLTCLPAHGSATLPIPDEAWRYLTVVDADGRGWPSLPIQPPDGPSGAAPTAEISPEAWERLSTSSVEADSGDSTLRALAGVWDLPSPDLCAAVAMHRVLRRVSVPADDAVRLVIASVLVPRTSAAQRTIEASIGSLPFDGVPGWQTIYAEVARLRD